MFGGVVFRYQTGEVVCRGDEILYSSWRGIVESVFKQGTRLAEEHGAQDGGVMLLFFTGGRVLLDTTDDEEDLVFLRRFDDSVRDEFERSGLLCKMCYADGTPLFPGDIIEQSGENGKVYRAHVKAVHAPFEPSSWDLQMPTGCVTIEYESGTTITYGELPSTLRFWERRKV